MLSTGDACMLRNARVCPESRHGCVPSCLVEFFAQLPDGSDATLMTVNGRVSPRHVSPCTCMLFRHTVINTYNYSTPPSVQVCVAGIGALFQCNVAYNLH